jgi:hypothetical protein
LLFLPVLRQCIASFRDPLQVSIKATAMAPVRLHLVAIKMLLVFNYDISQRKFIINGLEPVNLLLIL